MGSTLPAALLIDEAGTRVCTSDFLGSPLVLQVRPAWSTPCSSLTDAASDLQSAFAAQGLVVATVLTENLSGDVPTADDLEGFSRSYDMHTPVLADPTGEFSDAALDEGMPIVGLIVDVDLTIQVRSECLSRSDACAAVADMLETDVPASCP